MTVSHFYLSLTKQTGQACWRTIDNGDIKKPPRKAALLSYLTTCIFLSIIWSIKELSSFSQCHVSGNENFCSKSLKRGREKDDSDQIYIDPCLLSRVHTKTYASYKNEIFLPIVKRFLLFARLEFRRIDIIK